MTAIDPNTYAQLCETTGQEFVAELVETFLDDAPRLIAALRSAAGAQDAAGFRRAAHTFKSNSNTFGAVTLAAMARDLESRGIDSAGEIDALERAYSLAAVELRGLANG